MLDEIKQRWASDDKPISYTSTAQDDIAYLLDAIESLRQANSQLTSAAIEQPPYKADLLNRLQLAETVCDNIEIYAGLTIANEQARKAWHKWRKVRRVQSE